MVSNPLYVSQNFWVLFLHNYLLAQGNKGNCKEVHEICTILKGKNALPYPQGLKQFKLLSEEES